MKFETKITWRISMATTRVATTMRRDIQLIVVATLVVAIFSDLATALKRPEETLDIA
jgi:hypothetical protein